MLDRTHAIGWLWVIDASRLQLEISHKTLLNRERFARFVQRRELRGKLFPEPISRFFRGPVVDGQKPTRIVDVPM